MEDVLTNTEQQLKRLNRLVNDLLDVSRIAAGRLELQRETVDVAAIVHDVLKRFGEELSLTATPLEVDARGTVWAYCDRFRVDQVVTNLLSNAIKYGEGKPIQVAVEAVDSCARIRIRDEGIGISEADLERIFTRYERAVQARRFSGLGLGLYIVRQIVEAHGGAIQVTSQPGAGSTFVVDLPREA
jgi:signal transduction histidine kinase